MVDFAQFGRWVYSLAAQHTFVLLACLPGCIGLYNLIAVWQNFAGRRARMQAEISHLKSGKHPAASAFITDVDNYRPRPFYTVCGAICLSGVFVVVAALSGWEGQQPAKGGDMGAALPMAVHAQERHAVPPAPPAVLSGDHSPVSDSDLADQRRRGIAGLVFAGYGAYLYTLTLCISRLLSSALTGKFLTVSALRSAIALVLGFVAGAIDLFGGLNNGPAIVVFFLVGLFPSWAMDALRTKAQTFLKAKVQGVDYLPLRLIDGIDDGIADRLAELGLWDVQHMATANPFALEASTLYPIRRLIDWMDQAILIGYVRQDIAHFRALGIRGAIDFAVMFQDLMGIEYPLEKGIKKPVQAYYHDRLFESARQVMDDLSKQARLSVPCLYMIGRGLYEDPVVEYLWDQWFKPDEEADGNENDETEGDS